MSVCCLCMTTSWPPSLLEPLTLCRPSPPCETLAYTETVTYNSTFQISKFSTLMISLSFSLSSSNLLANSFNCDCRLSWLGDWLRSRKIVTGNPRCQRPAFLKEIPLQDVAHPDFRCEEGRCWYQDMQLAILIWVSFSFSFSTDVCPYLHRIWSFTAASLL